MRPIFQGTIEILNDVLNNTIPYKVVCKRFYSNHKSSSYEIIKSATNCAGSILRHYLVLDKIISNKFPKLSEENRVYIMFPLVNKLFVHATSDRDAYDDLKSYVIKNNLPVQAQTIVDFCNSFENTQIFKNEVNTFTGIEYFSLRYNVPKKLVNQLLSDYGKDTTLSFLKSIVSHHKDYLMINTLASKIDNFTSRYVGFIPSNIDGFMYYVGDKALFKVPAFTKCRVFKSNPGYLDIVKKLELDPLKNVAFYADYMTPLTATLNVYYRGMIQVNHIIPQEIYFNFLDLVRKFDFKRNSVTKGDINCLNASLSDKVNTFICMPKNSNYQSLIDEPDYFYFAPTNDEIDYLLTYQMDMLEEASKFVLPGGQLVYLIETCSKKESVYLVKDFLKNHKDFTLSYEKQSFPSNEETIVLYAAILKKEA